MNYGILTWNCVHWFESCNLSLVSIFKNVSSSFHELAVFDDVNLKNKLKSFSLNALDSSFLIMLDYHIETQSYWTNHRLISQINLSTRCSCCIIFTFHWNSMILVKVNPNNSHDCRHCWKNANLKEFTQMEIHQIKSKMKSPLFIWY